jgi:competence protein ComEC
MPLPLLWLTFAFVTGIVIASQVHLDVISWAVAALTALVLAFPLRRLCFARWNSPPLFLILAILFAGGWRYQIAQPEITPFHIAWYNDRDYEVLVTGMILEPPDVRDVYANLKVEVQKVDTGNDQPLPAEGLMLARVDPDGAYAYGEIIRLRGKLKTPPENEDFSYRDYLARFGIHSYMSTAKVTRLPLPSGGNSLLAGIYALKARALANLYQLFPDPEASLIAGILLGVDTGLPPDLQQAFKDTGTAHIIAISGFNIAIIAGLFAAFFSRFLGPRRGAVAAVVGIGLYTLLVGGDAAVVRAAIMGGFSLFARQVGRRQDGFNTLMFVAAIMAVLNPFVLWDVGFQLSFFATLGLILYAQPFQQWATEQIARRTSDDTARKIAGPLAEFVLFTFAAQLTTLPIMAYHFGRISLVSLLANPLILPIQPPVMLVSGAALVLSLAWMPLGQAVAWGAWPFPLYTIRMVEWFDRLPHGVIVFGDFGLLYIILFYAGLFGMTFFWDFLQRFKGFFTPTLAAALLAIASVLTWRSVSARPNGLLSLTFLDVGSADAVLIQTPTGRSLLVNGGPSVTRLSDALGRRLPPFNRGLDWLIVASTQENQLAALPRILDRFPPANVLWAGNPQASYASRALDAWVTEAGLPVTRAAAGQRLNLGDGAWLTVVNVNSRGAVLLVEWNKFRLLLPIGFNFAAMDELQSGKSVGSVSALLLAESGYAPVNPPEWIQNLHPQLVILDVAAGDPDGLPHDETLEAAAGYTLLRTDRNGWIKVTTDGMEMWVEAERK